MGIIVLLAGLVLSSASCSSDRRDEDGVAPTTRPENGAAAEPAGDVLIGAGEIGGCTPEAALTASLLESYPQATVVTFGGHTSEPATADTYASCYGTTWGGALDRTRPAVGKTDLAGDGGAAYYDYFGAAAGAAGSGWYSYDVGSWHLVVLNSDCDQVGCKDRSDQVEWLRADLASSRAACIGAYWEKPRFSSGSHGNTDSVQAFWDLLHEHGADFVLNGYDAGYERFGPLDAVGVHDPANGVRQFVVGTGGAPRAGFESIQPNSEVRDATSWGVIKMTLHEGAFSWEFLAAEGSELVDFGTARCSGAPPEAGGAKIATVAAMAASEDDAEERRSGRVSVDSTDLEMILDVDEEQTVGLRFPSVELQEGKNLVDAYVQFVAGAPSVGEANFRIFADISSGAPFSDLRGDLSRRTTSESFVTWLPANWNVGGELGPAQRTPDLRRVIAEVTDRAIWRSGDPVVLLITGSGLRIAQSVDRALNRAPVLHLVFEER